MKDLVILAEKQCSYTKMVFLHRKEHFAESLRNPLFQGESTAAEVFIHGIEPLYQFCHKILMINSNEKPIDLNLDRDMYLPEQYIDLYEKTVHLLKKLQLKLTEEDLNDFIPVLFTSDSQKSLRELLSLNIMHAVTHIGQALRLQALYLRNRM